MAIESPKSPVPDSSKRDGLLSKTVKDKKAARISELKRFDWTSRPPRPDLTPFQKFIHDVDWNNSPLGPMEDWPIQLRQMVVLVVADPSPAVIYWDNDEGVEHAIVYNEAYTHLIGQKHPGLQGQDPKIGFAEIWDTFVDVLEKGRRDFEVIIGGNQFLLLDRHGFLEETYFSWKFTPVVGPEGYVVGSHATVVENTRQVIQDRRFATVRALDAELSSAKDMSAFWSVFLKAMEHNTRDIPFAAIYSTPAVQRSESPPDPSVIPELCLLEGSIGTDELETALPKIVAYDRNAVELGKIFKEAAAQGSPRLIDIHDQDIPANVAAAFRSRGCGTQCTQVVICSIPLSSSKKPLGFLVLGLNPHKRYDLDHQNFIGIMLHQTASIVNRIRLSAQLSIRTREWKESELQFSRFTTRAPVGLAVFSPTGTLKYANDFWFQLTGFPKEESEKPFSFLDMVDPQDNAMVEQAWLQVVTEKRSICTKIPFKTPWSIIKSDAPEGYRITVLSWSFVDLDENGEVQSVMNCLTDVTELNWVEDQLRKRTKDLEVKMQHVLEMKKQQENFIDMTSHEIRNPLSAVLHCAEEIYTSLADLARKAKDEPQSMDQSLASKELSSAETMLAGCIEAAETITYCVLHQKRIVDDILVLSRLDSQLLAVTPVATQPKELVQGSLKMFEAEVKTAQMRLEFHEDASMKELDINWLMFDPNRVIQILVNLVGNAIKFTRSQEDKRLISVTMSASLSRPSDDVDGIDFVPVRDGVSGCSDIVSCGDGEFVYLGLSVLDTGHGLSAEEKKILFERFMQASPKTHTKYGGSGLGLFISRQLTELHGGQIGVNSEPGKGSCFFFFIKTRRTVPSRAILPGRRSSATVIPTEENIRRAAGSDIGDYDIEERPLAVRVKSREDAAEVLRKASPPTQYSVLVVEDNLINQKVIRNQLQKQGCIVHVANHGQEALEIIQTTTFWSGGMEKDQDSTDTRSPKTSLAGATSPQAIHDSSSNTTESELYSHAHSTALASAASPMPLHVVLMDLEMPIMDGITCVRRVRELQTQGHITAHVPIIAVTANARGEQLSQALEAGMDGSVTKPYRIVELMEVIQRLAYTGTEDGDLPADVGEDGSGDGRASDGSAEAGVHTPTNGQASETKESR